MRCISVNSVRRAFTLVEVLIVVVLLGIVAMAAVPAVQMRTEDARNQAFVTNLNTAVDSIQRYVTRTETWPGDRTPGELPEGLDELLGEFGWDEPTPIGGQWDWDYGQFGYHSGVSVYQPDRTRAEMAAVDELFDDGDLDTGAFRARNQGYIRIIHEEQ